MLLFLMDNSPAVITPNQDTLTKCRAMKTSAFNYRRRRHPDWVDNYSLYRDKVMINRLTQRQSVNVPLIKSSIKTLLKDIDNPPQLFFSNLENKDQQEVFYNSYWEYAAQRNSIILKDIVDKRQVMLFGRSFKSLNLIDGHFFTEIVDPQDILIDRYVDPSDIDSARFLIHEHIYKPLSSLKSNPMFDNDAVKRLQLYLGTDAGLIKAEENQLDWIEKQGREAALGVIDAYMPILGETYVELNKWFVKEFNKDTMQDEIMFMVTAEDMEVLYKKPLHEHIGPTQDDFWKTHIPYSTWGDETERTDFWSDGVADTLRTLNKILNSKFSQWIENGTLRNYGMNYFNSSLTDEGFLPQTFEPVPWGWYPIPVGNGGKIGDSIMRVDVPELPEFYKEVEFIMNIAQQASAATSFQQGVKEEGQNITLGEVNILVGNAQERVKSMAIYYQESWKDFGLKYTKMLEAAPDLIEDVMITKKGRLTKKKYSKIITPQHWYSEQGYKVEVRMKEDQQQKNAEDLQKIQYAKSLMPMNPALDGIVKHKSLEFADLSSSEIEEVMRVDEEQMRAMAEQAQAMAAQGLNPDGTPLGSPPAKESGGGQPQQQVPMALPAQATA